MLPTCNGAMMRNIYPTASRGYQPYPHPNPMNRYPQVSFESGVAIFSIKVWLLAMMILWQIVSKVTEFIVNWRKEDVGLMPKYKISNKLTIIVENHCYPIIFYLKLD